uniref:Uncharacterized protein n=1 Tax=Bursaphelenchus xylophilus TaxID=6326 RepID=A0A1I7RMB5_BURXY
MRSTSVVGLCLLSVLCFAEGHHHGPPPSGSPPSPPPGFTGSPPPHHGHRKQRSVNGHPPPPPPPSGSPPSPPPGFSGSPPPPPPPFVQRAVRSVEHRGPPGPPPSGSPPSPPPGFSGSPPPPHHEHQSKVYLDCLTSSYDHYFYRAKHASDCFRRLQTTAAGQRHHSRSLSERFELRQTEGVTNIMLPLNKLYIVSLIASSTTIFPCICIILWPADETWRRIYKISALYTHAAIGAYNLVATIYTLKKMKVMFKTIPVELGVNPRNDNVERYFSRLQADWKIGAVK